MQPGLVCFVFLSSSILLADPRPKPADYPAHVESAHVALGAEYMVHSFSNGRQTYFAPDYLIVDTAIYPKGPLVINSGHFRLLVNGVSLAPISPGVVAYSLKNTGFDYNPQSSQRSRFPGDPSGSHPPQSPQGADPTRADAAPGPELAEDVVVHTALQDGEFHSPQSGFLYFAYGGKLKKIKSLDLVYSDEAGELKLTLIP